MIKRWVIIYPAHIEENTKCDYRTIFGRCWHNDREPLEYGIFYPKCKYSKCPLKLKDSTKNSP